MAIEAEKEEERRIKMLEKNPLGELPGFEEEEDFNFGTMLAVLSLWVIGLLDHTASINGTVETLACTFMHAVYGVHSAITANTFASSVPYC